MYKYFDVLEKYFGDLDLKKKEKLRSLYNEYYTHNQKINLVSRKDFDNFYLHHVIHSLTLSKYIKNNNLKIIDLGSGGGLPGIPLSIIFEKNNFLLVDSIKKKINTLDKIINSLKLKNVETLNARVESINNKCDLIICRGVSKIDNIIKWTKGCVKEGSKILLLKGGNVEKELKNIRMKYEILNLENIYSEEFFTDKKIIKIEVK